MARALAQLRALAADLVRAALAAVLGALRREPVRIAAAIAALVTAIVPGLVDEAALTDVIAQVLVLLGGGEALRAAVFSPATLSRLLDLAPDEVRRLVAASVDEQRRR